jgi:DNA-binding LacI/PurR family transcriptional regulator
MAKQPHQSMLRARRVTATDVAARAGVSQATVSYILNDTPGQSFPPATRAAVRQAAEDLDYRPDLAARVLAGGSGILLIVVPAAAQNGFNGILAEHLTSTLSTRGVLATISFESTDPAHLLRTVDDLRPRGVLFVTPPSGAVADAIRQRGVQVVEPAQIENDFPSAGELQVRHLQSRGHRKLGIAVPTTDTFRSRTHAASVEGACGRAGLEPPTVGRFGLDGVGAEAAITRWLQQGVTGICAVSDDIAFAVLHGIRRSGAHCPNDIAVVGMDGTSTGAVAAPPLTTVSIDIPTAVGWYAARLLSELGYASSDPSPDRMLQLVIRESS